MIGFPSLPASRPQPEPPRRDDYGLSPLGWAAVIIGLVAIAVFVAINARGLR